MRNQVQTLIDAIVTKYNAETDCFTRRGLNRETSLIFVLTAEEEQQLMELQENIYAIAQSLYNRGWRDMLVIDNLRPDPIPYGFKVMA